MSKGNMTRLREQALQAFDRILRRLLQQPQRALQLEALVHAPHKIAKHYAGRIYLPAPAMSLVHALVILIILIILIYLPIIHPHLSAYNQKLMFCVRQFLPRLM